MIANDENIACLMLHIKRVAAKEKYRLLKENQEHHFFHLAQTLIPVEEWNQLYDQALLLYERSSLEKYFILTVNDTDYPRELLHLYDPPFAVFIKGNLSLFHADRRKMSVVGTRTPSLFTIHYTAQIVEHLCRLQYVIVSGMAVGIDSVAHHASLNVEQGATIGVIAHGFHHRYPKENFSLFQRTENSDDNIALISEYLPHEKPMRYHFPKRNRLIAALGDALFFMEGGIKSGAMNTVNSALDLSKDIYAVDNQDMYNNEGGKKVLQDGALSIDDFFQFEISTDDSNKKLLEAGKFHFIGNNRWLHFHQPHQTSFRFD